MRAHLTSWTAALAFAVMTVACGQTDTGITTSIKSKFAADDTVKASQIDVDTKDKIVTLTGTVDSEIAKNRAMDIARATKGVTRVTDNLMVRSTTAAVPPAEPDAQRVVLTDPSITASVKSKMVADPDVGALRIDVDTRDGVVTLTGTVKTRGEKDQALRIARDTDGVKSVVDKLTVRAR
jgi:hyperosmotically inducible protein